MISMQRRCDQAILMLSPLFDYRECHMIWLWSSSQETFNSKLAAIPIKPPLPPWPHKGSRTVRTWRITLSQSQNNHALIQLIISNKINSRRVRFTKLAWISWFCLVSGNTARERPNLLSEFGDSLQGRFPRWAYSPEGQLRARCSVYLISSFGFGSRKVVLSLNGFRDFCHCLEGSIHQKDVTSLYCSWSYSLDGNQFASKN